MNRIAIIVIALALASCLAACTTSVPTDQPTPSNTDSQGSHSRSPERAVSAEDIAWTVEPGSIEGNDMIVLNYTNNSSVDVFGVRLEFRQADGVTDEQRAVFDELYESNSMWEDMNGGKDEVYVGASSERYLQPGESNTTPCTFNFTATPVSSMEQYELMEPKTLSIAYKDGDRVYLEYYDFATDSYSSSSQGDKQAVTWSNSELAQLIPRIEAPVIGVSSDSSDYFSASAYGVTRGQYESYVAELENRGFTADASKSANYFMASNADGYDVTASFNGPDESMSVSIDTY